MWMCALRIMRIKKGSGCAGHALSTRTTNPTSLPLAVNCCATSYANTPSALNPARK